MTSRLANNPIFVKVIPYIFIAIALGLVYFNQASNAKQAAASRESGKTIRVYVIATNCFLAVPADQRTNDYIRQCYNRSESIVGTTVQHFGGDE